MKKPVRIILTIFTLAVAVVGALWWAGGRKENANAGLATAQVERRDFTSSVLATGAVKAQVGAEVRVGARISGKVVRLHANIGDEVKAGQVLAELEQADLEATVRQREAELAEAQDRLDAERREGPLRIRRVEGLLAEAAAQSAVAQAELHAIERERATEVQASEAEAQSRAATMELARKQFERHEALRQQDFVSQDALDQAREVCSTAEAQLKAAQKKLELAKVRQEEDPNRVRASVVKAKAAREVAERALNLERVGHEERLKLLESAVARARAALDHAKVQLSYATITAPLAGVIGAVTTQEGETVAAGLNAPTFVIIIDLNRLQVDAFVDEVDIGKIKTGQQAIFTVDAFPAREFKGGVVAIYPKAVIQENVVNYDVVVEIADPYGGLLRPEMTASVTIFLETREQVLAIPKEAVRRRNGRNVVYVASGEAPPQPREIKVGWRDGGWVEVVQALSEGEMVLLEAPSSPSENEVKE